MTKSLYNTSIFGSRGHCIYLFISNYTYYNIFQDLNCVKR